jgi:molybdopterin-binding protein
VQEGEESHPLKKSKKEQNMEISARNALKGTVKALEVGAVNTEVVLEVAPGVEITAIITKASAEKLALSVARQPMQWLNPAT